ncbi:MAG: Gfo/Idh/MocA family oxidoreductase [Nitrospinae bacterium]|nr:Gfo/Idh/MocA family oxidoreductase [Nitrospinota bacterium]
MSRFLKSRNKKKYSVAVIGCGRIGSILEEDLLRDKPCTHAGAFFAHPKAEITAGCDIDEAKLKKFGEKWKVKKLYADYKEMLSAEKPDIVCVAAWTNLHKEMVIAAAESGAKGIFCEKPIAINSRDGQRMVDICGKRGVMLSINHERRYEYRYQKAKELVDSGAIGSLKAIIGNALSSGGVKAEVKKWGGGGYFHDGTHLIDLLLYFGGDIKWVSGFEDRPHGKNYIEETAGAVLAFRNGAMAFVEGGGGRKYFSFELDIQGTTGRIIIGNATNEYYTIAPSPRYSGFTELEKRVPPFGYTKEPSRNMFAAGARDLVDSIENGRTPLSNGEDGLMALKIIEATYRSARSGGKRIFIPSSKKKRTT